MRVIMDVRCTECGEVNEVYARIGDDCTCPACSSTYRVERANKLISPVRCSLPRRGQEVDKAARAGRKEGRITHTPVDPSTNIKSDNPLGPEHNDGKST